MATDNPQVRVELNVPAFLKAPARTLGISINDLGELTLTRGETVPLQLSRDEVARLLHFMMQTASIGGQP